LTKILFFVKVREGKYVHLELNNNKITTKRRKRMSEVKWWGSDEVEWNGKRIEFDFPHVVHSQQFSN
jgi:hypothetical protein